MIAPHEIISIDGLVDIDETAHRLNPKAIRWMTWLKC